LPEDKYTVERADEDKQPGAITPRIISKIISADVVVADLSGFNPNVFYELAVAHGYVRPVVHMQRSDEKLAFDVKDMRVVRYLLTDPDRLESAVIDLRAQVELALASPSAVETPLTAAGRFRALDTSVDPQAEVAERLSKIEEALQSRSRSNGVRIQTAPIRVSSDTFAAAEWIENELRSGTYASEEIKSLMTEETSRWFDSWVEELVDKYAHDEPDLSEQPDPWKSAASEEPPF
jgi:hypothetical protein